MSILCYIVPSVIFLVAIKANTLHKCKRKLIYLSKTANIILLSYLRVKLLTVKHDKHL